MSMPTEQTRPASSRWLRLLLALVFIVAGLAIALTASRPVAEDWLLRRVETALITSLVPNIHFDGGMHWHLQPVPTLALHQIRLQHGQHQLMTIDSLTMTLDAQALLDGKIVIDSVRIIRPQLDLGDDPQHWLSAKAWLRNSGAEAPSAPPITLRLLELEDAGMQAQLPEQHLRLRFHSSDLALTLAPDASASARFEVYGDIEYTARPEPEHADLTMAARLGWDGVQLSADDITLAVTPQPATLANPGSLIPALLLKASLQAWPAQASAEIALNGQLASTRLQGSIRWQEAQAYPFALQLRLDSLNLDEWMARIPASEEASSTDLQPWRNWPVSADIRVDSLHWQQVIARGARIRINTE